MLFGRPRTASLGSVYVVKALGSSAGSATDCLTFLICQMGLIIPDLVFLRFHMTIKWNNKLKHFVNYKLVWQGRGIVGYDLSKGCLGCRQWWGVGGFFWTKDIKFHLLWKSMMQVSLFITSLPRVLDWNWLPFSGPLKYLARCFAPQDTVVWASVSWMELNSNGCDRLRSTCAAR